MTSMTDKWGEAVAERGFAQVPNHLLLINQFLDPEHRLSPAELLVLIQLAGAWWKVNEPPFPSVETLAKRCGVSGRQVQRAISHLEALNLIKRVKRRSQGIIASNAYDLGPLVTTLNQIAETYPNEYPRRTRSNRPDGLVSEVTLESENVDAPAPMPKRLSPATRARILALRERAASRPKTEG